MYNIPENILQIGGGILVLFLFIKFIDNILIFFEGLKKPKKIMKYEYKNKYNNATPKE